MPTLPNMGIETPTQGGDSGTWDDKINAGFALVDAHDHSAGKGARVKTAGLSIDADLPFGGFGATTLGKAAFSAVTALAAGARILFVSSADNELYWRNQAGVNVKLTSGTSINTSLVGGIGGDYSTVGADLDYDDANKRYTFRTQTGTWARIATGPVRIHEYDTTETVYVELAVAAGLGASYTLTWPAALPAATADMRVSAAGLVSFGDPDTIVIPYEDAQIDWTSTTRLQLGSGGWQTAVGGAPFQTDPVTYPVCVPQGMKIKSWSLAVYKASDGTETLEATLYKRTGVGPGVVDTVVGAGQSTSAVSPGAATLGQTGLTQAVAAGESYRVRALSLDGSANHDVADYFGDLTVTFGPV